MQFRNTFVMGALLLVLGAFVYFYEIRGGAAREEAEREAELFLVFEPDDVQRVEVTTAEGSLAAVRDGDGWRIVEPHELAADDAAIDSLVDRLAEAKHERLVVEAAEDLAPYGLADPEVRITVTFEDGEEMTLAVGKDTPVGANAYAMAADDDAVYSTTQTVKTQLDKSLHDLRDRSVLRFDESAVTRLELATEALQADVRRTGVGDEARWVASAPFAGRADADTIDDAIDLLAGEEAEEYLLDEEPAPEQLAEYGLDAPRATITVWTDDDASHQLLIGAARLAEPADDAAATETDEPGDDATDDDAADAEPEVEGYYARRAGNPSIFVIATDLLEDLPATVDALRNKDVLDVARDRISAIELRRDDSRIRLDRTGADWRISVPRDLDADPAGISALLGDLTGMRAEGFADAGAVTGLEAPELEVEITVAQAEPDAAASADDAEEADESGETGETGEVSPTPAAAENFVLRVGAATRIVPLSRADDEDAEEVDAHFVSVDGDSAVYLVTAEELEDVRAGLFDLRDKTLVQFSQSDLTEIEVTTTGGERFAFAKSGETWAATAPDGAQVEDSTVTDVLWDLNYLRMEAVVEEWDAGQTPDLSAYGLDSPEWSVTASTAGGVVASVALGGERPAEDEDGDPRVYVAVGGVSGVYEVSAALRDSLRELIDAARSSE